MIQDLFPARFHNEFRDVAPRPEDTALFFSEEGALVAAGEELRFPKVSDFPGAGFRYLFSVDEERFFLVRGQEGGTVADELRKQGFRFADVRRDFRRAKPRRSAFAGAVGLHLANWYRNNKYCGTCGEETADSATERALVCPRCGRTVYPGIAPAVIVGVVHDGKLLMTKYAGRSYRNFALVAGFAEIGESIEETVRREVAEEVGLRVKNLRYYKSQPWPFTGSLLMGFFCELDGEDEAIELDQNELSEAGWFPPEEVPDDVEFASLTSEMMAVFKRGEHLGGIQE